MKLVQPTLTCPELGLIPDDGKRYELVDGEVIVSSSPSEKHQRTSGRLFRRMGGLVVRQMSDEFTAHRSDHQPVPAHLVARDRP
jgi:hypothetical protein